MAAPQQVCSGGSLSVNSPGNGTAGRPSDSESNNSISCASSSDRDAHRRSLMEASWNSAVANASRTSSCEGEILRDISLNGRQTSFRSLLQNAIAADSFSKAALLRRSTSSSSHVAGSSKVADIAEGKFEFDVYYQLVAVDSCVGCVHLGAEKPHRLLRSLSIGGDGYSTARQPF